MTSRRKPIETKRTPARNQQVAATILKQLGGQRFIAMTGAKDLVAVDKGLQFGLRGGLAKDGINKVRVTLTPWDTYDVDFYKVRGTKVTTVRSLSHIYAGDLQPAFQNATGLDTRL